MKRLLATLLLISGTFEVTAQNFPSQQWHKGEVRLTDNTYLVGNIKYDLDHEAIQLVRNGKTETYSAQQVTSFKIIDGKKGSFRYFFTLPFAQKQGRKRPTFFEVIVEGKATLLAREYVATVSTSVNRFGRTGRGNRLRNDRLNNPANRTRLILAHKMYVVNLNGDIQKLTARRKDLFYILKGHDNDLKQFIKQENIKLDRVTDMASVVGHYNAISTEQTRAH